MVIPWNAPLSRCLTMIESVQGQKFSRYVPEDITTLLSMTQPLKLRGFQKWDVFCNAVNNMMNNPHYLPTVKAFWLPYVRYRVSALSKP